MRGVRIAMIVVVGLLCAVWVVVSLLFDSYHSVSPSMMPTIGRTDPLLVRTGTDAKRGDIVVFHPPEDHGGTGVGAVVKRVVAVAGDRVSAEGGHLVRNGRTVREPYLGDDAETRLLEPIRVPAGSVYVLGDLRTNSTDSRNYGPVPRSDIVGRVVLVGVDVPRILRYALVASLVLLVAAVASERSTAARESAARHPSRGW